MKEQIWLPSVKYLCLSLNTSQALAKTNMSEKRGILK